MLLKITDQLYVDPVDIIALEQRGMIGIDSHTIITTTRHSFKTSLSIKEVADLIGEHSHVYVNNGDKKDDAVTDQ